jgi:hypothetical protein
MKRPRHSALALTLLASACGGKLLTLSMEPVSPAYVDESSVSPSLQSGIFERIMIVPPPGSGGIDFQENLAAIERSFISRGITVISSAITSRVILDEQRRDRPGSESGLQLSEVERALVLARNSNADAVLQVGVWEWSGAEASDHGTRYFLEDIQGTSFREIDRTEFEQAGGRLTQLYAGDVLGFTGRLIDVESGEVIASFKIEVPVVNVSEPLAVTFDGDGEIKAESYSWTEDVRRQQASIEDAIATLFERLAAIISQSG